MAKNNTDKKAKMIQKYGVGARFLMLVAVLCFLLALFFTIGVLVMFSYHEFLPTPIILTLFFYIIGGTLLYLSIRKFSARKRLISVYNLVDCGESSIDKIAVAAQVKYSDAVEAIEKLIKDGYLNNVYVNVATGHVEGRKANADYKPIQNITCPNCHATTSTQKGVCEYCGASLQ